VSDSVEEVYELRKDLQVLAEAFKEKEVEVAVLQDALVAVEQQFQEVQAQLETAKSGEISTNQELESSLKQLSTTQVHYYNRYCSHPSLRALHKKSEVFTSWECILSLPLRPS